MRGASDRSGPLGEGALWKRMTSYFFPILFGALLQQLYNTADAMIVGRSLGKEALAAVGGSPAVLINLLFGFFIGLSSGATVIISQCCGAGDRDGMGRAVHTAVALALSGGAFLAVFGASFAPLALSAMGVTGDVMPYAVEYMRILFGGMIFSLLYNIGSGILRAIGDSRRPLFFLAAGVAANISLDALFVLALGWEVAGAAWATVISQALCVALVLVSLSRADGAHRLAFKRVRFDGPTLKRIVKIGIPAGLQSSMYGISNIFIQSGVNSIGTDATPAAAWTAFGRFDGLFWMSIGALGVSITTFVGQIFGSRNYGRIKDCVRVGFKMGLIIVAFFSLLMPFAGRAVLGLFADDPLVVDTGMSVLLTVSPFYIAYLCIEVFSGTLRGTGETLVPMLIVLGAVCAFRALWVQLLVPIYRDIRVIAVGYPAAWLLASAIFTVYYLRGNWLRRRVALQGGELRER